MANSPMKAPNENLVQKKVRTSTTYSGGWVDDFIGLPNVTITERAVLLCYNSASSTPLTYLLKRNTDQKIAIGVNIPSNTDLYISGICI